MLSNLKNVLSEIHLLLTPDREHGKVSDSILVVGFRRAKPLKDILLRAKVARGKTFADCVGVPGAKHANLL